MTNSRLFPVVCAGCPCLCDDIGITLQDRRIIATEHACPLGTEYLLALQHGEVRAYRRGQEITVAEAIQEAAQFLRTAAMPGIFGLSETSLEAIREAVALAESLQAVIAPWPADPTRAWGQQAPDLARSWAEIRSCDVLLFWRADPLRTHPRLMERLTSRGARAVVLDAQGADNLTASHGHQTLRWPASLDLSVVRSLRLHLEKGEPLSGPAQPLTSILLDAKQIHLFLGSDTAPDGVIVGQWQFLAAHRLNKSRISISVLPQTINGRATTEVLTWRTGFAGPVRVANGKAVYGPSVGEAARLLAEGMVDVALCVGPVPGNVHPRVLRLAIGQQSNPQAEISFVIPGLSPLMDGHVQRADGILLRLAGESVGWPDPTVALLAKLREAVS